MPKQIPKKFDYLFWDHDSCKLSPKKHTRFIIERLLEKGDLTCVKWVFSKFETKIIRDTISHSKNISSKTKAFWDIMFTHENFA